MAKIVLNVTHVTDEATNTWSDAQIDVCPCNVYKPARHVERALAEASKFHIVSLQLQRVLGTGEVSGTIDVPANVYQMLEVHSHRAISDWLMLNTVCSNQSIMHAIQARDAAGNLELFDIMEAIAHRDNMCDRQHMNIIHKRVSDDKGNVEVISLDAKRRNGNYINVQFRRVDDEEYVTSVAVMFSDTPRHTFTMVGASVREVLQYVAGVLA
jgi:hypothetical protein